MWNRYWKTPFDFWALPKFVLDPKFWGFFPEFLHRGQSQVRPTWGFFGICSEFWENQCWKRNIFALKISQKKGFGVENGIWGRFHPKIPHGMIVFHCFSTHFWGFWDGSEEI